MTDSMDVEWANDSEDKQGLLQQDSLKVMQWSMNERQLRRKHNIHLLTLYSVNFIVTICLVWTFFSKKDPSLAIYSPANSVVSYKTMRYTPGMPGELSPYQGEPTPESNKLWEDLYVGISASKIPKNEADQLINTTYELPDTEGEHVVSIEVFHQLHCLNIIRRSMLYPEYFPGRSMFGHDGEKNHGAVVHADHCIDRLRQGLMCSSNLAVSTWRRPPKSPVVGNTFEEKLATDMKGTTTCRDFNRIREWAVDRQIEGWIDAQ